jgi:hypothetical protein
VVSVRNVYRGTTLLVSSRFTSEGAACYMLHNLEETQEWEEMVLFYLSTRCVCKMDTVRKYSRFDSHLISAECTFMHFYREYAAFASTSLLAHSKEVPRISNIE